VARSDHRHDVRDALWEVQSLRREVVALRREVERLQGRPGASSVPDTTLAAKVSEAQRLAGESASAMDHLLQAEVLLWQAVDRLEDRVERLEPAAQEADAKVNGQEADPEGFASCA
jgi:ribulose 1,5-bisphosphate carboxylase large subunit-like protein